MVEGIGGALEPNEKLGVGAGVEDDEPKADALLEGAPTAFPLTGGAVLAAAGAVEDALKAKEGFPPKEGVEAPVGVDANEADGVLAPPNEKDGLGASALGVSALAAGAPNENEFVAAAAGEAAGVLAGAPKLNDCVNFGGSAGAGLGDELGAEKANAGGLRVGAAAAVGAGAVGATEGVVDFVGADAPNAKETLGAEEGVAMAEAGAESPGLTGAPKLKLLVPRGEGLTGLAGWMGAGEGLAAKMLDADEEGALAVIDGAGFEREELGMAKGFDAPAGALGMGGSAGVEEPSLEGVSLKAPLLIENGEDPAAAGVEVEEGSFGAAGDGKVTGAGSA